MLLNLLEYHWAEHIDDALLLLSRTDVKTVPLAGGTYLAGLQDDTIQAVVDLRDLELAYITEDTRGIHIGSMMTLQNMVESPLLKKSAMGILSRAAHASSFSRLIRNSATIGGTIGAGTASQADLLTALAVMDAEIVLRSGAQTIVNLSGGTFERPGLALAGVSYKGKQERRVPLNSFAVEHRVSELILEVVMPHPGPGTGASFMRIGRTPSDIALLNAAALVQITGGVYQKVRLAFGGVNMEPIRMQSVERQLEGQTSPPSPPSTHPPESQKIMAALQEGMAEFRPPSDFRASSEYRRLSAINLGYRVLEEAINVSRSHEIGSSEGEAE